MRVLPLVVLGLLCACDSPTTPIFPPTGEYTLVAATPYASSLDLTDGQWQSLPVEYDITGNGSCNIRVTGGSLRIANRSYSVDLQQQVVSCDIAVQPASHEEGTLSGIWDASTHRQTSYMSFEGRVGQGWLGDGSYNSGVVGVELVPPAGGAVNYLKFERVP